MRILASDGMEKNAVAALRAQGHEVVEQFYEPAELAEQVKNFVFSLFVPQPKFAFPSLMRHAKPAN